MIATEPMRVLLVDGAVATIRPYARSDQDAALALHRDLTERSTYLRFFSVGGRTAEQYVRHVTEEIDHPGCGALVVELAGELVALGSYSALGDRQVAEVAFTVADDVHSRGVGTLLLEHLASAARRDGIGRFVAEVLAENAKMLKVIADAGLQVRGHRNGVETDFEIPLEPDDGYLEAIAGRESVADIASLGALFRPSTVAVVGASRRCDTVGHAVLRNLSRGGFNGRVYPVNPHAAAVAGLPAYASIGDLPEVPDLAVICVPAAAVPVVAEECGARGVRALVVLTSGITAQPELADRLKAAVGRYGMRMVGPNCFGVISAGDGGILNATFGHAQAIPGGVGLVTQSGGIGIAVLEELARLRIGLSTFASTGDKYDLSSNDLLMWWSRDPATRLCVLYMESFGNPRKFSRLARRLSARKPVIALRAATSETGQRAAASHTAASASSATIRDALFRQAGVVAVDTLGELTALIAALASQPLPAGRRLAIVSNAGGGGVVAVDAAASAGLVVPEFSAQTRADLRDLLPAGASVANPVDTTATVDARTFGAAIRTVLADDAVDGVIAISVPTALGDPGAGAAVPSGGDKPVLAVRLGQAEAVALPSIGGRQWRVPRFNDPAVAVAAYARTCAYAEIRERAWGEQPDLPDVDLPAARRIVAGMLDEHAGGGWLPPDLTVRLLRSFGVPVAETVVVTSADAAIRAAESLGGGAVAMKAVVDGMTHKSDAGGVLLGRDGASKVRSGYEQLAATFGERLRGVAVQAMAEPGVETLAGVVSDPVFGPLVVFGAGGVTTDLLADRAVRLAPVTDVDAAEMVGGLRVSLLLSGYRGAAPADTAAVRDCLIRIGRMAELLPEVAELDLNPLVVRPDGCVAVDARVRILPRVQQDPLLRRLR
ncbi:bifunctional GNAT family N-acetyltransferase/acetate--CoA ligase family protein [Fodinicola acaciae]|uniref:bifunctional acetate--CoA ligase family protein/GNAT family N-acetyltransferase n=1 Tax=Fodinicola acaciae TaxID=2681555 RepID=UPI001C9E818A|nr:bifunctional GNAT family N-acetyltransferase/acetate--CoA ligase family protein [Fodinicola acaciae]